MDFRPTDIVPPSPKSVCSRLPIDIKRPLVRLEYDKDGTGDIFQVAGLLQTDRRA